MQIDYRDLQIGDRQYRVYASGSIEANGKIRKFSITNKGYCLMGITYQTGKQKTMLVHRIVAEAFFGTCPDGMQVAHNDGNPQNNSISNLRYAFPRDNMADQIIHGTRAEGENAGPKKLNAQKAIEIADLANKGVKLRDIGKIYGVDKRTVSDIRDGKTWSKYTGVAKAERKA